MSSVNWREPAPAADLGLELALLCDALDVLRGGAFFFAVCEEGALRRRLTRHVGEHLEGEGGRDLIEVELSPEQPDLAGQLGLRLLYERPEDGPPPAEAERARERSRPPVVFVHVRKLADAWMNVAHLPAGHPDRVRAEQARRALRALNFQRERLGRLDVPLVFWISQNTLGQMMQHAADIFAARSGLFYFETPVREPTAPPPLRAEVAADMLDSFHRTLLPPDELRQRAALYEQRLERERSVDQPNWPGVAFLCRDLAHIYRELDDHQRVVEFQEQALEAYRRAIAEWDEGAEEQGSGGAEERQEWAALQFRLGLAYYERRAGERGQNLARAIACYEQALRFWTPESAPLDYAMTQNNLGTAYAGLPTGERGQNLARAIACYEQALRFWTPESAPLDYATTQNNLGNAYLYLPTGERGQNLARAIACYEQALRFRTAESAPLDYAMTQNNLGAAYQNLPTGERGRNLARAIACYEQALGIEHLAPWSRTRYLRNLGDAYSDLEEYGAAIEAYRQAIDLKPDDLWLFSALGNAHSRQKQHEQAIGAYTDALAFAVDDESKALLCRNRASSLIHLDRLDEAEQDCGQARALAPDHPYTRARLGQLSFARQDYPAAIEHYTAALERQEEPDFYFDRGLARLALGQPEPARADYQAALPLADAATTADALEELEEFAAAHPDTPGLDAVRALFPSS